MLCAVGPVHLARINIQSDAVREARVGRYNYFNVGAVQIGPPDERITPVRPVHSARRHIQGDAARFAWPVRHQVFDVGAVKVRPPDRGVPLFGPVHLARTHIQRDAAWVGQSVGQEVFDVGAIQISPLYRAHSPAGPVHLARRRIQSDVLREGQSAGHQVFDGGVFQLVRADGHGADSGQRVVGHGGPLLVPAFRPPRGGPVRFRPRMPIFSLDSLSGASLADIRRKGRTMPGPLGYRRPAAGLIDRVVGAIQRAGRRQRNTPPDAARLRLGVRRHRKLRHVAFPGTTFRVGACVPGHSHAGRLSQLRLARNHLASHPRCPRDFTALAEIGKRRRGQCEGRQRSGDRE